MQGQRHQPDYVLYFTVVILTAVGVITVYSASTVVALQNGMTADHFAIRQLASGIIGIAVLTAFTYIPHRFWYKIAVPSMMVSVPMLLLVLAIGKSQFGGKRWIGTSSVHLQPSELAIITTALYLAYFFTRKATVLESFNRGLRPALIVVAVNFGLIFIEPDMGTALTLLGTALVIIFVSGTRLKPLLFAFLGAIPVLVYLAMSAKYRKGRLTAFLHPFAHHSDAAYQLLQGWTAISAGGWFGRGFGMSIEKMGYLPFPQTDFIFPVFMEEWGYVGGCALLITFGVMIWRGFRIARFSPDRFGSLVSVGITSMIAMKTLINLGAISGLLPVTGIPLPFISYGGTSLIVNLGAIGILLSVSSRTLEIEPEADELAEVVDVEDAREARTIRSADCVPSSRSASGSKRTGQVHALVPRNETEAGAKKPRTRHDVSGSWQARQEAAVARTSRDVGHVASRTRRGESSSPKSWRERNGQTGPRPSGRGASTSRERGRSRDDRDKQ